MSYEELAQQMVDLHTQYYGEMAQLAHDMTAGGEATLLHLLLNAEGDVFATDLARETGLSAGRIASILKKLEDKGLITRSRSKENRRKYLIELTPTGREAASESDRAMLETHERVLRGLGIEGSQSLLKIISRLCETIREQGSN